MRKSGVCTLLAIALLGYGEGKAQAQEDVTAGNPGTYANPVIGRSMPDPTVMRTPDGTFWLYATENIKNTPIYRSDNLVDWTFAGTAFTKATRPDFEPKGGLWAPDINYINGKYVLYYSMSVWGGEWTCGIGVATADRPQGPFTDHGKLFRSNEIDVKNSIDQFYIEEDGHKYLFWGSFRGIYAIELSDDGLSIRKGAEKKKIAGTAFEGTYIHKRGDYYYLFASVGSCCEGVKSTYRLVVGRSRSLFGPYVDKSGKDMMENGYTEVIGSNDRFVGNGHCSEIVQDDAGNDWIFYHGIDVEKPQGRQLLLDQIRWDAEDWPYVTGHVPSLSAERPVFNTVHKAQGIQPVLEKHDQAVHVKDGWIRDPYIYLASDGYYYLTGTTPLPDDPREKEDKYNIGMTFVSKKIGLPPTIVGYKIRVWRSPDLVNWEYRGEPFSLEEGYWAQKNPEAFATDPKKKEWLLWAPEMYLDDGKWIFVHTSPDPVAGGANLVIRNGADMKGSLEFPMGDEVREKHDPSLFKDDDGTWYFLWSNTLIAPIRPGFKGLAAEPVRIEPANRVIGHEGATMRKIGNKYVFFGTAWSTDQGRKGSYNLYYCTADSILGPYSERRFAGRFLGHGTPFQDKAGRWWCTAFFNGNVPPLDSKGIQERDLGNEAQTINEQGTTIVPLDVQILPNGDVYIRALDPRYATPGPDEKQAFDK